MCAFHLHNYNTRKGDEQVDSCNEERCGHLHCYSKQHVGLDCWTRKGGVFVTPVLRPRIETLRFRSKQRDLAFPSVDPRRPRALPDNTSDPRTDVAGKYTSADMKGIDVRLDRLTSITRIALPRLILASLLSALLAGCGGGSMNNSSFTGTVGGNGSIVGTTPSGGTSSSSIVYVAWNPTTDSTVTGYQVFYGPTLDAATTLASSVAIAASGFNPQAPSVSYRTWEDLGLHAGDSVCFRLRAYNPDGVSDPTAGTCTQV